MKALPPTMNNASLWCHFFVCLFYKNTMSFNAFFGQCLHNRWIRYFNIIIHFVQDNLPPKIVSKHSMENFYSKGKYALCPGTKKGQFSWFYTFSLKLRQVYDHAMHVLFNNALKECI